MVFEPFQSEIGYGFCLFSLKGLKRGIDSRGQVWKGVWKIIHLVWNRVRVLRTVRHTPTKNVAPPPPESKTLYLVEALLKSRFPRSHKQGIYKPFSSPKVFSGLLVRPWEWKSRRQKCRHIIKRFTFVMQPGLELHVSCCQYISIVLSKHFYCPVKVISTYLIKTSFVS